MPGVALTNRKAPLHSFMLILFKAEQDTVNKQSYVDSPMMDWIHLASITAKSWSYRIQEKDEDAGESKADCYEVQKA